VSAPARARAPRWIGFALGAAMVVAAVWAVASQSGGLGEAARRAAGAPWWLVGLGALLPLANLWCIGMVFWHLTARYLPRGELARAPLGVLEMQALIASAFLFNYTPLRAGMVGRIAYHKTVHGVAVRDSVKVLGHSLALGAGACALVLGAATLGPWALAGVGAASVAVGAVAWLASRGGGATAHARPSIAHFVAAGAWRVADVCVWAARYWVCFAIVGVRLDATSAAALAIVSQAAMLVPFVGNGLGVREWAVGIATAWLPGAAGVLATNAGATAQRFSPGLSADLVNRGLELVVAVPVGLCGAWFIARRLRAGKRVGERDDKRAAAPGDATPDPG
jgi:hypothetical protein